MKKPLHQVLYNYLSKILIGILALGTFLDAISNAVTLITPAITYSGTVVIVIIWGLVQLFVSKKPISWVTKDGTKIKIRKLNVGISLPLVGMILLLWIPRFITTEPIIVGPILETLEDADISNTDVLGELSIEYPIRMSPGSSDTVIVSINIPELFVSLEPVALERVEIPSNIPPIVGELHSHQAVILVRKTMHVELSSPTFKVGDVSPSSKQSVNIDGSHEPTFWSWTIVAPDVVGLHVLTVKVFRGDDSIPSWIGSLKVKVEEPTPTSTPTSTPGPTNTPTNTQTPTPTITPTPTPVPIPIRIGNQLIDNSGNIVTACIALIGVLAGVYATIQNSKRQANIRGLEQQIARSAEEREELNKEIARLKSIKRWQFWKR